MNIRNLRTNTRKLRINRNRLISIDSLSMINRRISLSRRIISRSLKRKDMKRVCPADIRLLKVLKMLLSLLRNPVRIRGRYHISMSVSAK